MAIQLLTRTVGTATQTPRLEKVELNIQYTESEGQITGISINSLANWGLQTRLNGQTIASESLPLGLGDEQIKAEPEFPQVFAGLQAILRRQLARERADLATESQ